MSTTYEFELHPLPYLDTWRRAWMQRVIDGDTFYVRIDLGFHIAHTISLRLLGVDAPELSTEAGKALRDQLRTMLEGQPLLVRTDKDKQSFARWLGDVQFYADDDPAGEWQNLADWLLAHGLAQPLAR